MQYAPSDTGSTGSDMGLDFLMNPSKTLGKDSDANPYHPPLDVLREVDSPREDDSAEEGESFDDDDDGDSAEEEDMGEEPDTRNALFRRDSPRGAPPPEPKQQSPPPPPQHRPSVAGGYRIPPGATIEDIKRDLLYQFERLEKKGYKLHRRFTMASNVDDMRQEYDRLLKDKKIDAAVRFQQTCLMGFVTGVELLNNRFDPFDLKLDGWSENVHGKLNDYDDTFEELAVKYSSDRQMAPELKLLLSVVGSAFMFHMTKKLSDVMPGMGEIFNENPELQRQFAGAAANMMQRDGAGGSGLGGLAGMFSGMFNNGGARPPPAQPMRGPQGAPPPQQRTPPPPQATRPMGAAPPPPQAPQQRSSAADVLNFMRTRQNAVVSEDNVEIMSQSDTSEISEVVSLSGRKRNSKNRTTLVL